MLIINQKFNLNIAPYTLNVITTNPITVKLKTKIYCIFTLLPQNKL